ncbi:hypothetical protein [Riemerella anatipestifer]|uniref:hypothetical protein n=1 Tax=Riemerella anatipestifer TaxID=34085 RepID=UPI001E5BC344|nr:hypothetical protein [Riemerella anatipestifer]UFZ21959.1 hypothetical protein AWB56_005725 [Riemerella anatipestifer]
MSSSPEFNKVNNISQILQDAFGYWQKTIGFQILFSVLYFGLLMTFAVGLFKYFGLETEIESFRKLFSGNYTIISQTLTDGKYFFPVFRIFHNNRKIIIISFEYRFLRNL